jgi:selT/selW/selH-like putative selenoprotein
MLQVGVIAFALATEPLCTALNIKLPENLMRELKEKKMMILMGAWFVGNTINNALTSTGAFEVYYEDALVFSKLETGRMPSSMDEIIQGIMRVTKQE